MEMKNVNIRGVQKVRVVFNLFKKSNRKYFTKKLQIHIQTLFFDVVTLLLNALC
jgi:hypothetical protein